MERLSAIRMSWNLLHAWEKSFRFAARSSMWASRRCLPPINTALVVAWDRPEPLVLEVHSHVDPATVRGIALQATAGLARGTQVRATGAPISVPVGDAVLGRLLDVVGTLRDRGPALPADTPRRGIHNPPPALEDETRRPRCSRPASR